jgi:hypothetical protein
MIPTSSSLCRLRWRLFHTHGSSKAFALARDWRLSLQQYGPGVIDLKIEELLQTPAQRQDFSELLDTILQNFAQYPSTIPASLLNERTAVFIMGVTFCDYKGSLLGDAVKKLQMLLAGQ